MLLVTVIKYIIKINDSFLRHQLSKHEWNYLIIKECIILNI